LRLESKPFIAVLPFVNMSAELENENFCNDIADEITNALGKVHRLEVAGHTVGGGLSWASERVE